MGHHTIRTIWVAPVALALWTKLHVTSVGRRGIMPTNAQKDTWRFLVDSSIHLQLLEFPLTSAMRIGTRAFCRLLQGIVVYMPCQAHMPRVAL